MDSHYPFGIFWPLCCLFFLDLRILITPLVSFSHCVSCSSQIYGFSLPLWYLFAIVISVLLRFTDSHYPFGIFWSLCCLFFLDLRILITPLVSFVHCVVCSSQIYGFSLPLWYLLSIVLSVLLRFTDSHYPFGIFCPLCCLFFLDLRILITPLVSFVHCVVCSSQIYGFSLPLWYLLSIVLSVLLRFTDSLLPLWYLLSFVHCVVCSSQIYGFSLPLWYLLAIVLSVLLRFTDSHYPFGICWPLSCLFFLDLRILISPLVSFGHCAFCSSQIYGFSLPLWYLFAIVFSVLLRFTDSHYPFGIFWSLCCLFFLDLRILITPLVSFVHCVVCSSQIYGFSLPLWYLLSIVLSVLFRFMDSHYPFGIFCPLCCLFFLDLRILITPLVSFVHCVVCSSQIYGFSLPLWYLLSIVLSVLLRFTDSHFPFGIFWPLCFLFFLDLRILITPLVSFGHCVVCSSQIYGFSLPLWYLLSIVLSVLLRFMDSHYPFGIFWPLCCLFFLDLRILITPLVSFSHCVFCSSQIYGFSLPLWYLFAIVISVLLRFTDSHYPFGIFWSLCCLFFLDLRILITPLVSFVHCVVCSSSIYGFSLPLWYLLSIVLSVLLRFTDSHYPFGIFCPLCCLFFLDLRILITPLVSFVHCVVCSSQIYGFSLPFGIFCPLCCLFFLDLRILITPLLSFVHCVVCSSQIYGFSLPLWYLLSIVLSVLLRFTDSHFPFGIFWPLCFLFFLDLRILITPLVSFGHCVVCSSQIYGFSLSLWYLLSIVLSVLLRFMDSHYPFGIFWPLCCLFFLDLRILFTPLVSFSHCVFCSSQIYGFSLPLWYLFAIVISVLLRFTDSHYPFGIFWSLCCLFFLDLRILITPLVSFVHCVVCSSQICGFSLPLWYLLSIVLSVLLRFTDSHYPFGIFCPLCCLFFLDLRILITPLVSFVHCVVCSSQIYGFSLPLWYLLSIVLSVLLRFTDSHYPFGIFCPLCCLFFLDLRILITPLVSFVHCVVCSSQIYGFSLPLWYLLAIVLSVLLRFTDSHYPFGICWPLSCLFFLDLRILISPLVSFGHCAFCSSQIYGFSLPLWYLFAIVFSVLLRFTDSHYPFGIFWSLCCLFFLDLRILITPLVSFVHCVVCSSQIYGFSLPLWYLLSIVLSVLFRFMDSHYPFGIFCPLCCLFFLDLRILITPLVSFVHCVVCSSQIYGFSLPLWYLLAIVLSVLLRFTDSHFPFGIFWPLCFLFFLDLRILITPLVSFGHCVVCSSQIYGFSLPLWYLLSIVLSVLLRFMDSHYPFGIFWPLCCLFFLDLRILITPLVSFSHCVFCSSQIYGFSLPLWYLFAIVISVLLRFTDSHYPFGIFWSLCCLFFLDLRILITPLVSFVHCVVCSSQIYGFSLPLWYLLSIVLSVLLRFTDSHYPFGIFCPLCCLFFLDLRILITPLVSFVHCVVCSSQIYGFSLPLWYLLSIVLSVLLRFTDSHYPFGIFCPLCCLFFLD